MSSHAYDHQRDFINSIRLNNGGRIMPLGTLKLPTIDQLREVAADLGLTLGDS